MYLKNVIFCVVKFILNLESFLLPSKYQYLLVLVTFYLMSAQEFSQDGVKIQRSNLETITNYITITYSNQEMNGLYMKNLKEKIN